MVQPQSRLDLEGTSRNVKARSRPNLIIVRSTFLSPQLEANHPHSLGRFYAFVIGVEPPPDNCGAAFIRQNELEGV